MSATVTAASSCPNRRHVARPIPEAPPVTMATLPASRPYAAPPDRPRPGRHRHLCAVDRRLAERREGHQLGIAPIAVEPRRAGERHDVDLVRQRITRRPGGRPDHTVDLAAVAAHDARRFRLEAAELGRAAWVDEKLHEEQDRLDSVVSRHQRSVPGPVRTGSGSGSQDDSLTEEAWADKPHARQPRARREGRRRRLFDRGP